MCFSISQTLSADNAIFFSCESSLTCFHSAVKSRPVRLIFGWYLPHPPWPCLLAKKKHKLQAEVYNIYFKNGIYPHRTVWRNNYFTIQMYELNRMQFNTDIFQLYTCSYLVFNYISFLLKSTASLIIRRW